MSGYSMFPDFISEIIQERKEGCYNCTRCSRVEYANNSFICSGIIEHPEYETWIKVSADIIKVCSYSRKTGILKDAYTPDETLALLGTMSETMRWWLSGTDSYRKFRLKKS